MFRRVALAAAAASIALGGLALTAGAAGAAAPPINASGALNCTAVGKAKISPALTSAAVIRTTTAKVTLTCTGPSGVTSGKSTLVSTSQTAQNGCTGLASGLGQFSGPTKWKGAVKVNPSTVTFSNGNADFANSGFFLPSQGPNPPAGTSTITGSFGGQHATAHVILDIDLATFTSQCNSPKGIKKLTFTGARGQSTLNIAA
jgi:hypothetical protein